MLLSTNFARQEFEKNGEMPDSVVLAYRALCETLLEPIRDHLRQPLRILSGYRSPAANQAAGGVQHSQHEATPISCAADFWVPTTDMRELFDWIRLESGLVWDQVILEHGLKNDLIHLSWVEDNPRRMALEGDSGNRSAYKAWPTGGINGPRSS